MRLASGERGPLFTPDERLVGAPIQPVATSAGRGWCGLRAEDYGDLPAAEFDSPPLDHHLVLVRLHRSPVPRLRMSCDGEVHEGPVPSGAVSVVPAGVPSGWWFPAHHACLQLLLSPRRVRAVGAETFDLDPARFTFDPVWCRPTPDVAGIAEMIRAELLTAEPGGRLCADSLATVLIVHLIRHLGGGPAVRGLTGVLARHVLRAVEGFVMDNLDGDLGLSDLAAVAHLSEYHFARLFKATTGQTPHQFVIARRVERAKALITEGRLTLAEVAVVCGFTDQSGLTKHFKRIVGVTPKRFG